MTGLKLKCALILCVLILPFSLPNSQVLDCREVRSSFQFLYPGMKWTPEQPVSGSDLQVCQPKGLTCCSRKMEERYLLIAKQNMESSLQATSARLKVLIIQNAAIFQEAFDMVLRLGRNSTMMLIKEEFPALGPGASGAVTQLFMDMSLYILGSDANVNDMVSTFFSRLFPLTYRRLLGNGAVTGISDECLRGAWRGTSAFGSFPKLMMTRLSRSLLATRVFLQALNLGIEVVNTTQHLRAGRDCGRSLLKLWYCPHCQGLLEARPCRPLCSSTMGACLGGAAEVQPHWKAYVEELGSLAAAMKGEQDIEAVVLRLNMVIRQALKQVVVAKSKVSAQVNGMCAHTPSRVSRAVAMSKEHTSASLVPQNRPSMNFDPDETLFGRRREFISGLRGFSQFYSGLGDALCSKESTVLNSSLCWNGQEMTDKFPGPSLKKVHPHATESRQKPPEPIISQIIDKLKHINQLLRMVTLPGKRWKARPAGGRRDPARQGQTEEDEEGLESGDCDDEDECTGVSGLGPPPRRKRLRIIADLADNLAIDDLTLHELLLTPRLATDTHGGASVPGAAWAVCLSSGTFLFTIIIFIMLDLQ
ncbi:Glypican-3 Intestinal protein OCI-5 [Triplophysa tibetana]|uniref:Glypican-3 n=1 Tax=Triplophysa tibetana TaxID=1572043 RepID=A0A5A9NMD2_9TELE|nr:Glypican-3 Intestinal protein OCI-5 [Triplophysa tibetana]